MAIKKSELLKLENQLCFKLYTASRLVSQLYYPLLEKIGITYPQYLVMIVLWEHENLSVKELGKFLYLDSGTLTPLLKKMEAKGLIKRSRDKDDERSVIISLTRKGEDLSSEADKVPQELFCKFDGDISELEGLQNLLGKLIIKTRK